jgi:hypothetical protein
MLRYARFPVTRLYAVEVSGWDRTESFFVEECELEWKEESDKQVTLKRALFDNAVLLVRLLQFDESGRSHPVVFEAEWVRRTKSGQHQFRLNTVVPRRREPESPAAWPAPASRAGEVPFRSVAEPRSSAPKRHGDPI